MLKILAKNVVKKFYVAPTMAGCVSVKREVERATPAAARFRASWVRRAMAGPRE